MGSEELNCVYSSDNIVRMIKSRRLTPTEKRPLGRPRRRWEDNIRMDLKVIDINTKN